MPLWKPNQKPKEVIIPPEMDGFHQICETSDQEAVICTATLRGNLSIVKRLTEAGLDTEIAGDNGLTALSVACREGHHDIVIYLVEQGASVETCDNDGRTALFHACDRGNLEIVEYLLRQGAKREQADKEDASHLAAALGGAMIGHSTRGASCDE